MSQMKSRRHKRAHTEKAMAILNKDIERSQQSAPLSKWRLTFICSSGDGNWVALVTKSVPEQRKLSVCPQWPCVFQACSIPGFPTTSALWTKSNLEFPISSNWVGVPLFQGSYFASPYPHTSSGTPIFPCTLSAIFSVPERRDES